MHEFMTIAIHVSVSLYVSLPPFLITSLDLEQHRSTQAVVVLVLQAVVVVDDTLFLGVCQLVVDAEAVNHAHCADETRDVQKDHVHGAALNVHRQVYN
ncbi:hypothetical protein E2C01_040058 [Portunus trituberculatus]|uniref:Uncharacterized protein n=1 Tax=Portunus trituberculatus TaxID=210409 RepID=A0A5B7FMA3_PORTR|nr:hypothetical protein [Portunus trituberculatus]